MGREFELMLLQVLHKDLHLRRKNFHGADCDVGSNLTTSLYRTITVSIRKKNETRLNYTFLHPQAEISPQ
jgi:hypothetical protein